MNTEALTESGDLIVAAVDAAGESRDLLDGLVDNTATDPSAPFVVGTLERLVTLEREDRAAFETLRAQLKKTGCVIIAADGDEPGLKAAKEAAWQLAREHRTVRIATLPEGQDFNDLLIAPANVVAFPRRIEVADG